MLGYEIRETLLSSIQLTVGGSIAEPKFRRVKLENGAFKQRIAAFDGGLTAMRSLSFNNFTTTLVLNM